MNIGGKDTTAIYKRQEVISTLSMYYLKLNQDAVECKNIFDLFRNRNISYVPVFEKKLFIEFWIHACVKRKHISSGIFE